MRKILVTIGLLLVTSPAMAIHTIVFRNASDLSTGTVANFLIDGGSVTKQGNLFNGIGQLAQVQSNGFLPLGIIPAAVATPRTFDIVIGSPTANNVDISSSNEDGLKTAITMLCGSSSTVTCTQGGSILMRTGVYSIQDTTIPASVKVYAFSGSSVVWVIKNTSIPIATVYGEIEGITFDYGQKGYCVRMLNFKTGSRGRRLEFWNAEPLTGNVNATIASIVSASNVILDGYITRNGRPGNGNNGMFEIEGASAVVVQNGQHFGMGSPSGGAASLLYSIRKSSEAVIFNTMADKWNARYVLIDGGRNILFDRHRIHLTGNVGQGAGAGVVMVNTEVATAMTVSSSTIISNTDVIITGASDDSAVFKANDASSKGVRGVIFDHDTVTCSGANTTIAFNVGAGVQTTIFRNNASMGGCATQLTDSGAGTLATNLLNFKDGVAQ